MKSPPAPPLQKAAAMGVEGEDPQALSILCLEDVNAHQRGRTWPLGLALSRELLHGERSRGAPNGKLPRCDFLRATSTHMRIIKGKVFLRQLVDSGP